MKFVVENLLPQGLAILAGLPKYGKSWFVLDLCLRVSLGELFLNRNTAKSGSLYLSLEDSHRRLQERIDKVLNGRQAPENLDLSVNLERLSGGLIEKLEKYLKDKPETSLIVVDTLQRIRDVPKFNSNAYFADYSDLSKLKTLADRHGICILVVHHLKKMADDGDVFNQVSGSTGIIGAADTIFVLSKAKRADVEAILSIIGRDVEGAELLLKFDKADSRWRLIGDAEERADRQAFEEYQENPLVRTIKELLKANPSGFVMTMTEMQKNLMQMYPASNSSVEALGKQIRKLAPELYYFDGILYQPPETGRPGGKRKHGFSYKNMEQITLTETDNI